MERNVRPPAVAGMFYPRPAAELARTVARLLDAVGARAGERDPGPEMPAGRLKALVVPHAGYLYSGPVAAVAYSLLSVCRDRIRRVILLGPSHRVAADSLVLPDAHAFSTPLGEVPVSQEAAAALEDLPFIAVDARAHREEHSLEVQLPFLQTVLASFSIVPLLANSVQPFRIAGALDRLWGGDETLIVVSSDLSHYLPAALAGRIDSGTAGKIERLEPDIGHEEACGACVVNGLLSACRRRGLSVRRLSLGTSADTSGDERAVVGYGAWAFREKE